MLSPSSPTCVPIQLTVGGLTLRFECLCVIISITIIAPPLTLNNTAREYKHQQPFFTVGGIWGTMVSSHESGLTASAAVIGWLLLVATNVRAEDHCSENRYNSSLGTEHLQFTKEVPDREYAILGQFKSLHCCAKGYRSIEW